MGSFLADCMSSLEQIRQQAAGSSVEQHAPSCHRRDDWEESSITAFVKALSQGDERLMTALLKLGMEHWGLCGPSPEVQTEIWGLEAILIARLERRKVFLRQEETPGKKKKKKLTKCVMSDEVFWVSFSHCCFLVRQHAVRVSWIVFLSPPHCAGAREGGKGNRRFMSFCDTRCARSHVNGKWDV